MRFTGFFVLMALFAFGSLAPAAAQHRSESAVERLINRALNADDDRSDRQPTVIVRDRDIDKRGDERPRGPTAREKADRRGRSETGTRTERENRTERTERAAKRAERTERTDRTERTERRDTRTGEVGRRGSDDRHKNKSAAKRGKGPKFCRSGGGHPVHGRQWCTDKGFGLGHADGVVDVRREDRRYPTGNGNRTILDDILGRTPHD